MEIVCVCMLCICMYYYVVVYVIMLVYENAFYCHVHIFYVSSIIIKLVINNNVSIQNTLMLCMYACNYVHTMRGKKVL